MHPGWEARTAPNRPKNFCIPLETKSRFSNFFAAAAGRSGRLKGPARRRAPVVSGAARNQLALWRIWLCAHTTFHRSGVRPSASTAFSVTAEQNTVTIEGRKADKDSREYLYQGISARPFKRQFSLADHVQVKSASFENGLLRIELFREVPEAMKPRRIAINGTAPNNVHQIEAKAA